MKLFFTTLRPMMAFSSASASDSLSGAGRSSARFRRIDAGTAWVMRVSMEGRPSAASIARSSSSLGPIWRATKGRTCWVIALSYQFVVTGLVEETGKLAFIGKLQLEQPAFAFRSLIDKSRIACDGFIDFDHFAIDRRINVGSGLDRFHNHNALALGCRAADVRQLDENEVTQLFLCVDRNADSGNAVFNADPLVIFGEQDIGHGNHPLR